MAKMNRLDQIVKLVDEQGYLSVTDLSERLDVSEMTIRRDLTRLNGQNRILRTFGGAASRRSEETAFPGKTEAPAEEQKESIQVDEVDVLVATSVNAYYDRLLLDRVGKKNIPIIAESVDMPNQCTVVMVNNYQAGFDLGQAAGQYLKQHGVEKAYLLDLCFELANTQTRSRGFADGLAQACPSHEVVLSINARSRAASAYQITRDALEVHPDINLIFAINDSTALGAIQACRELNVDPDRMVVVTFGLEGDTLKNELMGNSYCKIGLAMFPEIVSLACIDAAIGAHRREDLPDQYITPHVVLTADTLPDYYNHIADSWKLNWEAVRQHLSLPARLLSGAPQYSELNIPIKIGLIVPFSEHEWYRSLTTFVKEHASQYGAWLVSIDADQSVRDEVERRRRAIARKAAGLVEPGEVLLVDGGPIAGYLAEELRSKSNITVITNSVVVFNTLNPCPGIVLISTGGAVRYSSQVLVGPTAESALKELRADRLFLMAGGISLNFGLSHTNISEVTIKQAMIHSAREVVLLADHTCFTTESIIQLAPLTVVDRLITDDALQSSIRLDITKLGIRVLLA